MRATWLPTMLRRTAAAFALILGAGAAWAASVPFSASVAGMSEIVEVIDPAVMSVRVVTAATGSGSFGITGYRSTDIVSLATGAGSGENVFVTDDGDELFGMFTVQLVPLADPGAFVLFGEMVVTGGTGLFLGATGAAVFEGQGQFISAFQALTSFEFVGRIEVVPAPGVALLLVPGLVAMAWLRLAHNRRRFRLAADESRRPRLARPRLVEAFLPA